MHNRILDFNVNLLTDFLWDTLAVYILFLVLSIYWVLNDLADIYRYESVTLPPIREEDIEEMETLQHSNAPTTMGFTQSAYFAMVWYKM